MTNKNESKLIFLISQPRSGSSMLQQLLLNSAEIESTPEPWLMLNLIYTYKNNNINSSYNPNFAVINFKDYLQKSENGLNEFKKTIKSLALSLYSNRDTKNHYFLDKTPRYYHIIDELYELFPNAKFIFLVRNPLNVFSSILDYNFNGGYAKLFASEDRLDDLFLAPKMIKEAVNKHSNNIFVKYEDIVKNPKVEIERIFNYLELDMPTNSENYHINSEFTSTTSIDTKSLHKHNKPSTDYINSWENSIDSTQKKKLAIDFIKKLKPSDYNYFEYNLNKILERLINHKVKKNTIFNLNLGYFTLSEESLSLSQIVKKRIFIKLHNIWLKK
jgi:hypothetical protein